MMRLIEVAINSKSYLQGVALRKQLFFKDFENAQELIDDIYEKESIHVIAIENEIAVGTGRLTFGKKKAIISQMTVHPEKQKQGIGGEILEKLIEISNAKNPTNSIELSARVSAISFYEKYNFKISGDIYNSKKTGIPHRKMVCKLC